MFSISPAYYIDGNSLSALPASDFPLCFPEFPSTLRPGKAYPSLLTIVQIVNNIASPIKVLVVQENRFI